jgi:hypothetical protein
VEADAGAALAVAAGVGAVEVDAGAALAVAAGVGAVDVDAGAALAVAVGVGAVEVEAGAALAVAAGVGAVVDVAAAVDAGVALAVAVGIGGGGMGTTVSDAASDVAGAGVWTVVEGCIAATTWAGRFAMPGAAGVGTASAAAGSPAPSSVMKSARHWAKLGSLSRCLTHRAHVAPFAVHERRSSRVGGVLAVVAMAILPFDPRGLPATAPRAQHRVRKRRTTRGARPS